MSKPSKFPGGCNFRKGKYLGFCRVGDYEFHARETAVETSQESCATRDTFMAQKNKRNLQFFEAPSMRELYDRMEEWQHTNQKRLLSISIQQDAGKFCCIALTNPSEVVISDSSGSNHAFVSRDGALSVNDGHN